MPPLPMFLTIHEAQWRQPQHYSLRTVATTVTPILRRRQQQHHHLASSKDDTSDDFISRSTESIQLVDRRPHEQRVSEPRKARRLNHQFQYLYRHSDSKWNDNDWNDDTVHHHVSDKIISFYYETTIVSQTSKVSNSHPFHHPTQQHHHPPHPPDNSRRQRTALLAMQYLYEHGGYSLEEIHRMKHDFPPLLEMNVTSHLRPKMRFLKDCLGGGYYSHNIMNNNDSDGILVLHPKLKALLPANFYGARLERTIAPRHAFLVHVGLPSGKLLWDNTTTYERQGVNNSRISDNDGSPSTTTTTTTTTTSLLEEFLRMHRKPKQFAAMCNKWRDLYGSFILGNDHPPIITSEEIIAFDKLFQRGLLSAARNDSDYYVYSDECDRNNSNGDNTPMSFRHSLLQTANVTSAQLIRYLIQHGANQWEVDVRGVSLFHWAAGCGNLDGLQELVRGCNNYYLREMGGDTCGDDIIIVNDESKNLSNPGIQAALLWKAARDDATPLHWAAAGAGPKEFGIGGHVTLCTYLLNLCSKYKITSERTLVNSQTKDGNTVLMWSAWSRSLDVVKFLIRNRADPTLTNRNGCSVAHWASSGGDLSVCKYLHQMAHVDFTVANNAGNTPLSHAVAYGRYEVVQWLRDELKVEDDGRSAEHLAMDFVKWAELGVGLIDADEEVERRRVYSLFNSFEDWTTEASGDFI